jgi:quercetin dioxygenase-like cupin family protein
MSQLREVPTARPFVLDAEEGERIWFAGAAMTLKATGDTTGGELFVLEAELPQGFSPPLHVHHDEDEVFYILEGEVDLVCGGERYRGKPGTLAFLPRGIAHTFRVASDGARMLGIGVPGGFEGMFRDGGRPAEGPGMPPPAGPIDPVALKAITARYNHEIVGPPLTD